MQDVTMNDLLVVGGGTVALLLIFLAASYLMQGGTLDVWGLVRRYVVIHLIDEPGRAGERTGLMSGSPSSSDPVRGQQNQAEPREPLEREPLLRQLDKEDLIVLLAVQRNDEGGYRYSANQITAFVGGTAAPIKATIATVRGTPKATPGIPLKRPVNGW
jgi:hypothetical protein